MSNKLCFALDSAQQSGHFLYYLEILHELCACCVYIDNKNRTIVLLCLNIID